MRDDQPLLFMPDFEYVPGVAGGGFASDRYLQLRHIGFSHFESDECGGLNQWLEVAPAAQPVCGLVGAMVSVNDFSIGPLVF